MKMIRSLAAVGLLVVLATGPTIGQDKGKAKGQLPQGWSKLGLSDEQKQKIYEIQSKHKAKIDDLEKQIKEAREKMVKEETEVLTAAQKARLKEMFAEKLGEKPEAEKKK
ncbi:MAG: hypothetical protein K1X57_03425 [Gemmataceae bacterium]|nr:hypothetical protein [Gemmataceae bacterium]